MAKAYALCHEGDNRHTTESVTNSRTAREFLRTRFGDGKQEEDDDDDDEVVIAE
eukprot:CAMPEP_0179454818 /NCGR_PEP_ID=MMETSP0799-20121207/38777_1 /TAXON_ID=46947 /ORGANISM="Geminigera cryophila, Strain CCMP2564" /LENGTH=53 /DNA_ID=CAMNT_0021253267 /DNA_START=1 /DNA_END=159 /DNA_ORIENTATION=-